MLVWVLVIELTTGHVTQRVEMPSRQACMAVANDLTTTRRDVFAGCELVRR